MEHLEFSVIFLSSCKFQKLWFIGNYRYTTEILVCTKNSAMSTGEGGGCKLKASSYMWILSVYNASYQNESGVRGTIRALKEHLLRYEFKANNNQV